MKHVPKTVVFWSTASQELVVQSPSPWRILCKRICGLWTTPMILWNNARAMYHQISTLWDNYWTTKKPWELTKKREIAGYHHPHQIRRLHCFLHLHHPRHHPHCLAQHGNDWRNLIDSLVPLVNVEDWSTVSIVFFPCDRRTAFEISTTHLLVAEKYMPW